MPEARLRAKAVDDVEGAVDYYVAEADRQVAGRFVDGLEQAIRTLERHPEVGSLRFAFELGVPGLRTFGIESFPYTIFYVVRSDHLDVVRLLHSSRDIPNTLGDV